MRDPVIYGSLKSTIKDRNEETLYEHNCKPSILIMSSIVIQLGFYTVINIHILIAITLLFLFHKILNVSNFKCCFENHSLHIFKIYAMKTMMEVIQPPLHMQRKSFKHILSIQSNQYLRRHIVCVSCQVSCNFFTLIQLVIRCLILNFGVSPSSFQSSYSRTNIMRNNDNP